MRKITWEKSQDHKILGPGTLYNILAWSRFCCILSLSNSGSTGTKENLAITIFRFAPNLLCCARLLSSRMAHRPLDDSNRAQHRRLVAEGEKLSATIIILFGATIQCGSLFNNYWENSKKMLFECACTALLARGLLRIFSFGEHATLEGPCCWRLRQPCFGCRSNFFGLSACVNKFTYLYNIFIIRINNPKCVFVT